MEATDALSQFLAANDILIVDSVSSARVNLATALVALGAARGRMTLTGSMEEAREVIHRIRPRAIFCDFMIGPESGLDLIQEQRREYPPGQPGCLFVLVTGDASQSAVAQAAEEDVDTFVIKPYTRESFRKCLGEALQAKLEPGEYSRLIEAGKKSLAAGEIPGALGHFNAAKQIDRSPTLACFYLGQADRMKQAHDEAIVSFREGLRYNRIHYKCLVGLFELQTQQGLHAQAYETVKCLAQYFPANPRRLTSVLRLAIITNSFADIEGYYRIFTHLVPRTDELVRYICSALAVAGKYYLGQDERERALDLFGRIATSCAGRTQYLKYAVQALIEAGCAREAETYLARFPAEQRGGPDYLGAALLVAATTRPSGELIRMARELIGRGIEDPGVYEILISHSVRAGFRDSAEQVAREATGKWPNRAADFAQALETPSDVIQAA